MIDPSVKVIAFTGKARSGKDTAAIAVLEYLEEYNMRVPDLETYAFKAEAFAGPLKSMIAMLLDYFGLGSIQNPELLQPYIDGDKKEEVIESIGKSPRYLMQTIGTEWGRKLVNENLWVNSMIARIKMFEHAKDHGHKGAYVIITDCRYDNEAEALTELGIPIVQIVKPDLEENPETAKHASEAGLDSKYITTTVENTGTLVEYKASVIRAILEHLPKIPDDEEANDLWEEYLEEPESEEE